MVCIFHALPEIYLPSLFNKDRIVKQVDEIEFNQGKQWIKNEILIQNSLYISLRVIFQSVRGFDRSNKMALDDIAFYDKPCHLSLSKFYTFLL